MIAEWIVILYEWTKEFFGAYGTLGLFMLAIIESIFFPIPVEALLVVLVLLEPNNWWLLAIIAGFGSVLGAVIAYWLGYYFKQFILERFIKEEHITRVHALLQRHENLAVFLAAFTPIPYKVFAILAGVFYIRFWPFVFMSLFARTLRFLLVALITAYFVQQTILVNLITLIIFLFIVEVLLARKIWFCK